jgi:hypothetical protein
VGIADFIYEEMTSRRWMNPGDAASLARFDIRRITEELVDHLGESQRPGGHTGGRD